MFVIKNSANIKNPVELIFILSIRIFSGKIFCTNIVVKNIKQTTIRDVKTNHKYFHLTIFMPFFGNTQEKTSIDKLIKYPDKYIIFATYLRISFDNITGYSNIPFISDHIPINTQIAKKFT
jgi:hypothetical protein